MDPPFTTHSCVWCDVTEQAMGSQSLSSSGYSRWARGKVWGRLPDNKTISEERRTPRQKRWRSSNHSMKRPKASQPTGTLAFPWRNIIKTQTCCKNNPISTLPDLSDQQTCSHLMLLKGLWLVYYLNELDFPLWNLRTGFFSEQTTLITIFNSVKCKD